MSKKFTVYDLVEVTDKQDRARGFLYLWARRTLKMLLHRQSQMRTVLIVSVVAALLSFVAITMSDATYSFIDAMVFLASVPSFMFILAGFFAASDLRADYETATLFAAVRKTQTSFHNVMTEAEAKLLLASALLTQAEEDLAVHKQSQVA